MSRLIFLVTALAVLVGGIWYLSTVPKEQPVTTVETDVAAPANAG
jgi:hypothetical protein